MSLWEMSISGAVMILVIVVIRAPSINRLPKKTFLALWGVVLVRLLIPYTLPSAFSVYSLAERLTPMAEDSAELPMEQTMPSASIADVTATPSPSAVSGAPTTSVNPLAVIWLIGTAACAAFFAAAYRKCRREFRESMPVDNDFIRNWLTSHKICRTMDVRQSDKISAPLTYGVLRPVILLPKRTDWEDKMALSYVLAHEYVHIRRFDAAAKLVLTAAVCIHWFNPVVWIMYVLANRDIELSCDEAVVRLFGEHTKSAYAMTLIRLEEARSGLSPLYNNFSKNAIEERIVAIMKTKKTSWVTLTVALVLVVGVTTAFATSNKTEETINNGTVMREEQTDWQNIELPENSYPSAAEVLPFRNSEIIALYGDGSAIWTIIPEENSWSVLELSPLDYILSVLNEEDLETDGSRLVPLLHELSGTRKSRFYLSEAAKIYDQVKEAQTCRWDVHCVDGSVLSLISTSGNNIYIVLKWDDSCAASAYFNENTELIELIRTQGNTRADSLSAAVDDYCAAESSDTGSEFMTYIAKYAPFGVTFVKSGSFGNLYLNGEPVEILVDRSPDGKYMTISSTDKDGIKIQAIYGNDGNLIGVEEI